MYIIKRGYDMRRKERPQLTKDQIRRNIFLTTIVIVLIEVLLLTLIFVRKQYNLLWTPAIFVIVYFFALFMDFGKLKDLENQEENEEKNEENVSFENENDDINNDENEVKNNNA
jgi:ABC-type bacteriocin/lantibiotic exporter with double-glycine peptidase domain